MQIKKWCFEVEYWPSRRGEQSASVIKTILVLDKAWIPPNANFEKVNQSIDIEFLQMKLPLEPIPWPAQGLRRASINSFGFGGTNSHVVLDDAFHFLKKYNIKGNHKTVESPPSSTQLVINNSNDILDSGLRINSGIPWLLTLSAHSKAGLRRLADAYAAYFESPPTSRQPFHNFMANLSYTLDVRRSALPFKSFFLAADTAGLQSVKDQTSVVYQALKKPTLAFVFTGQGAQWLGMGRQLAHFPIFHQSITKCGEYLQGFGCSWSLTDSLWNESTSTDINDPDISQPASTALQIALVDLLNSIGIQPAAVIGHSSGEISGAYAYGALSAAEAMKIAYFRGVCARRLVQTQERRGAMIAVGLSEPKTRDYIEQVAKLHGNYGLEVACINSQRSTTVSGENFQVDTLKGLLDENEIFAQTPDSSGLPLISYATDSLGIPESHRRFGASCYKRASLRHDIFSTRREDFR